MSKSNYEEHAEKKQPELLKSTVTLAQAISKLKLVKESFSTDYYEAACETFAELFNLTFDELDRAVSGQKYWIT